MSAAYVDDVCWPAAEAVASSTAEKGDRTPLRAPGRSRAGRVPVCKAIRYRALRPMSHAGMNASKNTTVTIMKQSRNPSMDACA